MKKILIYIFIICCICEARAFNNEESLDKDCQCSEMDIAVLGDSMSWIGGEDADNPKGWTYHFKKSLSPHSIKLYARSGATITNTVNTKVNPMAFSKVLDDDNVIYNQVIRLKNDLEKGEITPPQLVIIYAGANDAWFAAKRPGSEDAAPGRIEEVECDDNPANRTTLGESLTLSIKNIRQILPKADILLITPLEMTKVTPKQINDLSDRIESVGEKWHCDILRADKTVDIRHQVEKKKFTNTSDGVHTNPQGAALLAAAVSDYVKNRYCEPGEKK